MLKGPLKAYAGRLRLRLERQPNLRRILQNSGWLFGDRFLKAVIGLSVGVWVARYLGPGDYGLLNYAIAFSALATPLATLGLQSIVVRDIVQRPADSDVTLGTAFVLRIFGSAASVGLLYSAIALLRPDDPLARTAVLLLALAGVFQALSVTAWWFESQVNAKFAVVSQNLVFVLGAMSRVALILLGASILSFVLIAACEIALSAVALALTYRWSGGRVSLWRARMQRAKAMLSDAWPFMLSSIAIAVYMKIDIIMLGEMSGNREVGVYAAAVRLSELWYLIPSAIVGSAFPFLVKTRGRDLRGFTEQLGKLHRVLALAAYLIAIPVSLLATTLVNLLFGASYAGAGQVLAVHIWACHAVFLGIAYTSWLTAENLGMYSLAGTAVGALLNTALNWLLIPSLGALGAAIATVIAYWFVVFVIPFTSPRTRSMGAMMARAVIPWPLRKPN